ncbi:MAG: helix-turn-helix domain-containing protein, partial [Deltaproteobacteria bacterium]|nr:helix-turn-helix domain-containing protein [Deltaproteobacteria bacterium]
MDVSERIIIVRGNLDRDQFAAKIGVSARTVQRWELEGELPKGKELAKIASEFKVNVHWLVTGEGEPYIKERHLEVVKKPGDMDLENSTSGVEPYGQVEIPKHDPRDYDNFALIPMAEAHLSAGGGAFVLSE